MCNFFAYKFLLLVLLNVPSGLIATTKDSSTCSCVLSSPLGSKKLLILNVNGVLCYFPPSSVPKRNVRKFGRNVDKAKVEVKTKVEDFLVKENEKIYVTIWSCMKLQDVLEVFPMLMPKNFMDQFVFIWGCE
jgi:hypothetical protein